MGWITLKGEIGHQPITTNSTVQNHKLGSIMTAWDDSASSKGVGEFIYLVGIGSTVAGAMVTYNASTYVTTLSPTTGAHGAPVAFAMAATVASEYGWYQIGGIVAAKKTGVAVSPQVKVYVSGTAGRIYVTASAGKLVHGAKTANLTTVVTTTSTVLLAIDRPHLRGVTSAI